MADDFVNFGSVRVTFTADMARGLASLKQVETALGQSTLSAQRYANALSQSVSIIGVALGGLTAAVLLRTAEEYDKALVSIRAVTKQTADEFTTTRREILLLAQSLNVSATEAAKGFNDIVQAGFSAREAFDILTASLKLSRAGLTDTATAASTLIQVLNAYKISANESSAIAGKLVKAVDLGVFTFERLASNIGQVAPIAKVAGVSLEELLGLLTSLTRSEANIDEVTTQIRATLSDLIAPSTQARAAMEGVLGVSIETSVSTRGFAKTLDLLVSSANGSASALAKMFPNIRAINAVSKIASVGIQELNKDTEILASTGAANLNRTLAIQQQSLAAVTQAIKAAIVNDFLTFFEDNRDAIIGSAEAIKRFVTENKGLLVGLAAAATAVAGLAIVLGTANVIVGSSASLFGLFTAAVSKLRGESIATSAGVGNIIKSVAEYAITLSKSVPVTNSAVLAAEAIAVANQRVTVTTAEQTAAVEALTLAQRNAALSSAQLANAKRASNAADTKFDDVLDAATNPRRNKRGQFLPRPGVAAVAAAQEANAAAALRLVAAEEKLAAAKIAVARAEDGLLNAANAARVAQSVQSAETAVAASGMLKYQATIANLFPTFLQASKAIRDSFVPAIASASTVLTSFVKNPIAGIRNALAVIPTLFTAAAGGVGALRAAIVAAAGPFVVLAAKIAAVVAVAYVFYNVGRLIAESLGAQTKADEDLAKRLEEDAKSYEELIRLRNEYRRQQVFETSRDAAEKLTAQLNELAEAAQKAAGGNAEAAQRVAELNTEIAKSNGGTNGVDALRKEYERLTNQIESAAKARKDAGLAAIGGVRADGQGNKQAFGDIAGVLSQGRTAQEATELAKRYSDIAVTLKNLEVATDGAIVAQSKLKDAAAQTRLAAGAASTVLSEVLGDFYKLSEATGQQERTAFENSIDDIDVRIIKLQELSALIKTRIDDLTRAAAKSDDPTARAVLEQLTNQQADINDLIARNLGIRGDLYDKEAKRILDINRKAANQEVDIRIDTLRSVGQEEEAARLAAEQRFKERMQQLEDEKDLTDAVRASYITTAKRAYDTEIKLIERNRIKKQTGYDAEEERLRRIEQAREENQNAIQRAMVEQAITQAKLNNDKREELRLRQQLNELISRSTDERLKEVNADRQLVENAAERVKLLQQEINDRARNGEGAAGKLDAARRAQGDLVGSTDAGSFRSAARDRLGQTNTQSAANEFVKSVTTTLKAEYEALERQRVQAVGKKDTEAAVAAAKQQKDVAERYRILLEEQQRAINQIKTDAAKGLQPGKTVDLNAPSPGQRGASGASAPAGQSQEPPGAAGRAQPIVAAPSGTADGVQNQQQSPVGRAVDALTSVSTAIGGASASIDTLSAAVEQNAAAVIEFADKVNQKFVETSSVLNDHTRQLDAATLAVTRTRILGVD